MLNEARQCVTTSLGTGQVVTAQWASCSVHDWPLLCSQHVVSLALYLHTSIMEHYEETSASSKHYIFHQNRCTRPIRSCFMK